MKTFVFVCLLAFGLEAPLAQASFKGKFLQVITLGIKKDKSKDESKSDEVAPPPVQGVQARQRVSTLTRFDLDDALGAKGLTPHGAISVAGGQARLTLEGAVACPAGRVCPQALRSILNVALPITSSKPDRACGATVITAKIDRRAVDGGLQKLTIVDNSTIDFSKCRFVVAPTPLEATFETEVRGRAGFTATESHFDGTELK